MILYPTETVYGLGVNALDPLELKKLYELKGRDAAKSVSWLVRDLSDIRRYAEVSGRAAKIAERFLPGALTLVLPAKEIVPKELTASDGTLSFRISSDKSAQQLIERFMHEHDAPLTATSANISGTPTLETPKEILAQFGEKAGMIDEVIDDGPRKGTPSTIVKVVGDEIVILREGSIRSAILLHS